MGLRYFAVKRLILHTEGGPLTVEAGDLIPDGCFEDGSAVTRGGLNAGEIAAIPATVAALVEQSMAKRVRKAA